MPEDFSTIEHDFLQIKDYFSNCKFIYKERKSKLDFFHHITSEGIKDTSDILQSAKQQLVEVKQVYKDLDQEIKDLSAQTYAAEQEYEKKKALIDELIKKEEELNEKHKRLEEISEKFMINVSLNEELDEIEAEIKNVYQQINYNSELMNSSQIEKLKEEEQSLKEMKQDLAAKQKRLTIVNTESYIEDIYCWYESILAVLKKIFGDVLLQMVEDRCIVKITQRNCNFEVVLKNKKILEVNINKPCSEELKANIENIKNYCNQVNDIKFIFLAILLSN